MATEEIEYEMDEMEDAQEVVLDDLLVRHRLLAFLGHALHCSGKEADLHEQQERAPCGINLFYSPGIERQVRCLNRPRLKARMMQECNGLTGHQEKRLQQ